MKNILVATDFSSTATNAVNYAIELAKATSASITLFHVYHIPVMVGDAPMVSVIPLSEIEKECETILDKLKSKIIQQAPNINVITKNIAGFSNDEIVEIAANSNFDLVILGIKGHGKVDQLLGSTATSVAHHANTPVLIIPDEARYSDPKRIVFAFDYEEIENEKQLNILTELGKLFQSKIYMLNVLDQTSKGSLKRHLVGMQADDILEDVEHVKSFSKDQDIEHGIDHYLEKHKADMLVMIRRKHSFFERIISSSHTKKMAFHTHIPLLVLHD